MTKITIPVSVTTMEHASFYQMNINEITYLGNKEEFNTIGGEYKNYCCINIVHCADGDVSL